LVNYVGGDKEQLYEVTQEHSTGLLHDFLYNLSTDYENYERQVAKYTNGSGQLVHNDQTRLTEAEKEWDDKIRSQFTIDKYGATMEQIGWHVKRWSNFFHVMDVARRYGSGVGSYGVDRFYVLLEGREDWNNHDKKKKKKKKHHHHHKKKKKKHHLTEDDDDEEEEKKDSNTTNNITTTITTTVAAADAAGAGVQHHYLKNIPQSVILDVKFEPSPAVEDVLSDDDKAWYRELFANPAARAVQAQRRLTSYTDPFTGWIVLDDDDDDDDDDDGSSRSFVVRQRSPWKASFPNLDRLTDPNDFLEFVEHVARITATSHARGTVGKSPAQFKHVLASVLGRHWADRQTWGKAVVQVAKDYRQQVLLDYDCFKRHVEQVYGME